MVQQQQHFATILNLLQAHELQHLFAALNEKTTLSDLQRENATGRPLLLAHLRSLGVEKLGDRQALANAIAKSEKDGQLPPPPRPIAQLLPPLFDETDDAITIWLKIPPETMANQLKVKSDANSLHVELRGEATACSGKLHDLVKPADTLWEIVRRRRKRRQSHRPCH